jgi:hypothetical protein
MAEARRAVMLVLAALLAMPHRRMRLRRSGVARYLDSVRNDPGRRLASSGDGLCLDTASFVASPPPCAANQRPASDTAADRGFVTQVRDAWSMPQSARSRCWPGMLVLTLTWAGCERDCSRAAPSTRSSRPPASTLTPTSPKADPQFGAR